MKFYKEQFKNKIIYCNCDNPNFSNFYYYFKNNFKNLELKELIISYKEKEEGFYLRYISDTKNVKLKKLKGNGDFRSEECIELLKEADIIITNPPFSLFRDFFKLLKKGNKQFLIIGNSNALSYKEIFKSFKKNEVWLGINNVRLFITPEGILKEGARSFWYTNLKSNKQKEYIKLSKSYFLNNYIEYDNYKAIEISKTNDIPYDFFGIMGVPITFLLKYDSSQFEIVGADFQVKDGELDYIINEKWNGKLDRAYIKGKRMYSRIFIRNIKRSGNNAV